MKTPLTILHHGGHRQVTGSCHELLVNGTDSLLVDCGLHQGAETDGGDHPQAVSSTMAQQVHFDISRIRALVVTHCHLDHMGRIPHLLAAGFNGPVLCSKPTALLLPAMLEDALRIGFTRDENLIRRVLGLLAQRTIGLDYQTWHPVPTRTPNLKLEIRLRRAGHILGSAYVQCRATLDGERHNVIFSGDLGAPYSPLLPAPQPAYGADVVVLESTYGDRLHEGRTQRRERLRKIIEHCFADRGAVLIPAFSIGRTQELLYELEELVHRHRTRTLTPGLTWQDLQVVVDSPLAARFTNLYRRLQPYWDDEARRRSSFGRHPLSFEQMTVIDAHADHLKMVEHLRRTARPTLVIAGGGMCNGGRIVNYLKALLGDPRTDVVFVGYQAQGTPGRDIQRYGPRQGYVILDGRRYDIKAQIHTLSGYSAHADQKNLVDFIRRMRHRPREIRLVHGEAHARAALKQALSLHCPEAVIVE